MGRDVGWENDWRCIVAKKVLVRAAAVLIVLGPVAIVGGCTDSSDDGQPGAAASGSSATDDSDASTPVPAAVSTTVDDLVAAGRAARALIPGSIVVDLDHELPGDYWEVELLDPDGSVQEAKVSADGSRVIEGPTPQADSDADVSQLRGLLAKATVDFEAAARTIESRYPDSIITELGLDDSGDRVVWEADVVDADGTSHEMAVGARPGEILSDGVHGR